MKKIVLIGDKDMSQLPRELFALVLAYASPVTLTHLASIERYNPTIGRELEHRPKIFEYRRHNDDRHHIVMRQGIIQSMVEYHGDLVIDFQGAIILLLNTVWTLPQSAIELEFKRLVYHNYNYSGEHEYPEYLDLVYIDHHDRLRLLHLYRDNENATHVSVEKVISDNVQHASIALAKDHNGAFIKRYLVLTKEGSLLYIDQDQEVRRALPLTLTVCDLRILTLGPLHLIALLDIQQTLHIYTWPDLVLMQRIPDVLFLIRHWTSFVYLTQDNKMHRWSKFGITTFDNNEVRVPFLQGCLFLRREGIDIVAFTPCQLIEEHINKYRCVNLYFKK